MNKKQMLKEQKRLKQERKDAQKLFQDDREVSTVIKITIGVILFIGIAFCVINIANGTWNIFSVKNVETEIDPNRVIVGTMLNKEDTEYLVLAYDMKEVMNDHYAALASNYNGSTKLYLLDLSSGFNSKFVGEKANITSDLEKLVFSGPTLMEIKEGKITKSYTDEKAIIDYFASKK